MTLKRATSLLLSMLLATLTQPLSLNAASYKTITPGFSTADRACIVPAPTHSVSISFAPDPPLCESGYHIHDYCNGTRPNIQVSPKTGSTNLQGCVNLTVYAPFYAGSYSLTAYSPYTENLDYGHYTVKYTGAVLQDYLDVWGVYQKQSDSAHGYVNYYLATREVAYLNAVAYTWSSVPGHTPIWITRISIPWGGWSDNNTPYWALANVDAHAVGVSWDIINNFTASYQTILLNIMRDPAYGNNCGVLGMSGQTQVPLASAPIWHVTC